MHFWGNFVRVLSHTFACLGRRLFIPTNLANGKILQLKGMCLKINISQGK